MPYKKEEFVETLTGLRRSENTIKCYTREVGFFFKRYDSVTLENIKDFVLYMSNKGNNPSSIRRCIYAIKTYCNIFSITINFSLISLPRLVKREASYVTDSIFSDGIISIIESNTLEYDMESVVGLFDILYNTGLRVNELLSLDISSYNTESGCLRVIGKGDKERFVPVGDLLDGNLLQNTDFFTFLNTVHYTTVLLWCKKFFGKTITPHSFRHGYTTRLVNSGVEPYAVQKVLGHASYNTTLGYYHMSMDEVNMQVITALS
jgi:integrase/recombinase XerD